MARKLWTVLMVLGLLTLAPAAGGLAATYELGEQGNAESRTWIHQYPGKAPWDAGTEFVAGYETYLNALTWGIGLWGMGDNYKPYYSVSGQYTEPQNGQPGTFTVTFTSTSADPGFFFYGADLELEIRENNPGISDVTITSNNAKIIYTANYIMENNRYTTSNGIITVTGTNSDKTPFKFTATLVLVTGNDLNSGYIDSASLEYPDNASAVPLPGSLLLVASGLLGLACLRRRRRKQ